MKMTQNLSRRVAAFGLVCTMLLLAAVGSQTTFTLGTTPGNAGAGKIRLWANTATGSLECLNNSGAVGCISGAAASVVTTTFSATPTFTCPSAVNGNVTTFLLSTALTENITSSTLASCTTGQVINFVFVQDGTGGRTVAMPTGFDPAPISPTASKTSTLTYIWDGVNTLGHLTNSSNDPATTLFLTERAAPGTPASGTSVCWPDSTDHAGIECKTNNSATVYGMTKVGNQPHVISFTIDGGGSAITTGDLKDFPSVDFACTINKIDIGADQSGSITVDVWKAAGAIPTSGDKISASAPVTLSSAQLSQSGSLSGWTTSVSVGDVFGFSVASATTVTHVVGHIWCQ